MPLYKKIKKQLFEVVKEKSFKFEKEIQSIVEQNLKSFLNLKFIRSEFQIGNLRIDTLAFDEETNSFQIIEYKRGSDYSVVDQGMSYLGLLLNNKADFLLEYNEHFNINLKRDDIDWSQSKVIFISPFFNQYQRNSINFKDLPIELWEIYRFENNLIQLEQYKSTIANASLKSVIKKSKIITEIDKEFFNITEDHHLKKVKPQIKETYLKLRDLILSIDTNIRIKPLKKYIAFVSKTNFVDLSILSSSINIFINVKKNKLIDPKNLSRDVSKIGHCGNGDYMVKIKSDENLVYIFNELIKQSYKINS
ncbi:MAG: DUF5655 domain-containing protein [Bacteroidota bacterium]